MSFFMPDGYKNVYKLCFTINKHKINYETMSDNLIRSTSVVDKDITLSIFLKTEPSAITNKMWHSLSATTESIKYELKTNLR